jgi:uncharacterized membrane protein YcfT
MFRLAPNTTPDILSEKSSSARVPWADIAKGICIILVVMGHVTSGFASATGQPGWLDQVVQFARPFRIPDFFLVSGLFMSLAIQRDWRTFIDRRVIHFLYFYMVWLAIIFIIKYREISDGSFDRWLYELGLSVFEPFSTLWFLYVLVFFSLTAKILKNVSPLLILAGAALLEIAPIHTGWTVVDEYCERMFYFMAGWLLAPSIFALARAAALHKKLALLGLLIWALMNGAAVFWPVNVMGYRSIAEIPVLTLVLGSLGAMAIIIASALLASVKWAEILRYCGEHSIAIYLAFFLPMAAARIALIKSGLIADVGTMSAITLVAAVIGPLVLERMVRDTSFGFLFKRPAFFSIVSAVKEKATSGRPIGQQS